MFPVNFIIIILYFNAKLNIHNFKSEEKKSSNVKSTNRENNANKTGYTVTIKLYIMSLPVPSDLGAQWVTSGAPEQGGQGGHPPPPRPWPGGAKKNAPKM